MKLNVTHETKYSFVTPPVYGLQKIRLSPKTSAGQDVLDWSLDFDGGEVEAVYEDEFKNLTHLVRLKNDVKTVTIVSRGTLDMTDQHGIIGQHGGYAPLWLFKRQTMQTKPGLRVRALSDALPRNADDVSVFHDLSVTIAERVAYESGVTDTFTTAEDALHLEKGVCQDHAHIFISAVRYAGYPARYVSGYLMMNDRISQDATHAWAEVWLPSLGWVGFDVSNQISPDARYIRLASGLDYHQAAPISGLTMGGTGETIDVTLQVQQQ